MTIPDYIPAERQTKIHFDPIPHKYYDDGGLVYTSVTTLIGKYKPAFNKKYWSMYVALRDAGFGVRPDMKNNAYIIVNNIKRDIDDLYRNPINSFETKLVVDKWRQLTEEACARGNAIHDGLESDINTSKGDEEGKSNERIAPLGSLSGEILRIRTVHDLECTGIQHRQPVIYARLKRYINAGCTLYAEKRIYSTSFQIAGMIDVLIVKGKRFAILDWKTNKDELLFESGYYKKIKVNGQFLKSGQFVPTDDRLFAPIDNLQNCKGNIYSLQLSLYASIMILWGYKLVKNGLEICHMRPGQEPKFIQVPFYQEEVNRILLHHYDTVVKENKDITTPFGIK